MVHPQLEKKRMEAMSRPLTQEEATTLLNLRFGGKQQYSTRDLLSEEYEGINGMRSMNEAEAHRLLQVTVSGEAKYRLDDLVLAFEKTSIYAPLTPAQASEIYDIEKVAMYNPATREQANLLYCDVHSKSAWS